MNVYLVYDHENKVAEIHLLEAVAEVRAGHFGGTFERHAVSPLPAYATEELQAVIGDLDLAEIHIGNECDPALVRVINSLRIAKSILTMFPEEALKSQDEYVSG